jgi:hypothetical protein
MDLADFEVIRREMPRDTGKNNELQQTSVPTRKKKGQISEKLIPFDNRISKVIHIFKRHWKEFQGVDKHVD